MRTNLNAWRKGIHGKQFVVLLAVAPVVAGCGSISDFSLKDQEWFARPGRMFKNASTIETPPLSVTKEVTPNDFISSDGACPGMPAPSAPTDANASSEAQVPATAPVALGHTECDVARAIGVAPDNVNLSTNERGERLVHITWMHGPRPGAYSFTSGRLTSIERVDVPAPEKPARSAKKKRS
ncbi:hypothetical protein V1291_000636 [Nitrobacteraceae bacterium AZCC 1564]